MPGDKSDQGQVYASNLMALNAWCEKLGMSTKLLIAGDNKNQIQNQLERAISNSDAIITIGGSWKSEKDMVHKVLASMKWKQVYRHLRLIPGKSTGMGILRSMPVFILPGSPTANMAAFLLLAMPGLKAMAGHQSPFLTTVQARLDRKIKKKPGWTKVIFGRFHTLDSDNCFTPYSRKSRLRDMASANAILILSEESTEINPGTIVCVHLIS